MAGCIIIRIGPIEGVDIDMTLLIHPKKITQTTPKQVVNNNINNNTIENEFQIQKNNVIT